ncbi:MAG: hypothetical protein Q9212_002975 [Teloschistes hypoglaucus]
MQMSKTKGLLNNTFTTLTTDRQNPEVAENGHVVVAQNDFEPTFLADSDYHDDEDDSSSANDKPTVGGPHLIVLTASAEDHKVVKAATTNRLTYVFTGQGAQCYAMGRGLIFTRSEFRKSLIESDRILRDCGSTWSLMDELLRSEQTSRIDEGHIAQPASTAIQIALVDLLYSLGLHPTTVVGHSSGEIAAAYSVGALSKVMALRASYFRGSTLNDLSLRGKGAMIAVGLPEPEALAYISQLRLGRVCVASVNSPTSTTISGDTAAIDELEIILKKQQVFARKLRVGLAYHSHHMEGPSVRYLHSLQGFEAGRPRPSVRYISTVTGSEKFHHFGPSYWVKYLTSKVRFSEAVTVLRRSGSADQMQTYVEIGPHSTLSGPVHQTLARNNDPQAEYTYLPSLTRKCNSLRSILVLTGRLFELGHKISLASVTSLIHSDRKASVICDLPSYPWDHSQTFWNESRLSTEYRLRGRPPHDLLGSRITSGNPLEPMWRNILRVDSLPWLRDHAVDGSMIFPGSGYLCSAIEALRQETLDRQPASAIRHFVLRDVVFSKARLVPESPGKVEIQLCLRPSRIGHLPHTTGWNDFRFFSMTPDGIWNENCRGSIMAELNVPTNQTGERMGDDLTEIAQNDAMTPMESGTMQEISTDQLYESLRRNVNNYGPTFATLRDVKIGDRKAFGVVVMPDIAACMPSGFLQPHAIHPTTLDAFLPVSLPLFVQHCPSGSVLPLSIEEVIIPADIAEYPGQQFLVTGRLSAEGPRSAMVHVSAFPIAHGSISKSPVTISNGEIYNLGQVQTVESSALWDRSMTYRSEWGVDIDFATQEERICDGTAAKMVFCPDKASSQELKSELLDRAASIYIGQSLDTMLEQEWLPSQKHFDHMLAWMHDYQSSERQSQQAGVEGELLTRVGPHIASVVAGVTEPLGLLLEGGLLHRFYAEEASSVQACSQLFRYLETLVFKHPHMKILGAGTGATTLPVLQALTRGKQLLFDQYHFTDISAGFFASARTLFEQWSSKFEFPTLDIEQDPISQGFKGDSYDLAIAVNVLHATHRIDTTLAHVRKLLQPGGRLAMLEITRPRPFWNTIFGLLPGWWNGKFNSNCTWECSDPLTHSQGFDEGRRDSPLPSLARWDEALSRGSFAGVEFAAKDFEDSSHTMTVMVSRLRVDTAANTSIYSSMSPTRGRPIESAERLLNIFPGTTEVKVVMACCLPDQVSAEATYIVLDEGHSPFLMNPSEDGFARLASLMSRAHRILWVTVQAGNDPPPNAGRALITGLSRSARSENQTLQLITLTCFLEGTHSGELIVRAIRQVLVASFDSGSKQNNMPEPEYVLQNGQLSILRLVPDTTINRVLIGSDQTNRADSTLFNQPDRCLKLCVDKPGLLDSLVFRRFRPERLNEDTIEIQVKAFEINFRDVLVALGQMKDSTPIAGECAGVVTAVGANCHQRFQIGDRVCGWFATPSYANSIRVRWSNASKIPDTMTFSTAASIPMVTLTAYYGLVEIARIQRDQTILIHSAAGGVGQAAIMIARIFGAKVFVTAGSAAKRALLVEKYGIPKDHIFSSRSRRFSKELLHATQGRGVDIILNSLSGEALLDSWNCIADLGTFVELGKADIYANNSLSMRPFEKSVTFASLDLTAIGRLRPDVMSHTMHKVMSLFESGVLTTVYPITTFPITNIEEAFRLIQAGKHMGKVVLEVHEEALVKAVVQEAEPLSLHMEGTHVITGGLGGLGREIVQMMSAHGARTILLLSRRNLSGSERSKLEAELGSFGTNIRIETCDIADATAVQDVAQRCQKTMPPVHGVIQAAMVLQDRILEQMTAKNFQAAVKPKVHGTLNLSEAFENPYLDFFIMLSSVSNILGSRSQSNYAAGNAFQDDPTRVPHIAVVFSHLPYSSDSAGAAPAVQELMQVEQALSGAANNDERFIATVSALKKHVSSLLATNVDNIDLDMPIESLDLDSLIATSEILDTPNLRSLASTVRRKSALFGADPDVQKLVKGLESADDSRTGKAPIVDVEEHQDMTPPQPPLMELESTLQFYLSSIRAFCSEEQFQKTALAVDEFQRSGGIGPSLQVRLVKRAQDPLIDSWLYDLYNAYVYLKQRAPINPWGVFFGTHAPGRFVHSQAERAAIISATTFEFKLRLDAGEIETEVLNGQVLCMHSLRWLFNSIRAPGASIDTMQMFSSHDYLIALRRGHFFKVPLTRHRGETSLMADLMATFQAILDRPLENSPSIPSLTADHRASWAELPRRRQRNAPLDATYARTRPGKIMTDCTPFDGAIMEGGFVMPDPDHIWIHYEVDDQSCRFSIKTPVGKPMAVSGALVESAKAIRELLEGSSYD